MLVLFCLILFAQAEIVEQPEPRTLEEQPTLKQAGKVVNVNLGINADVNEILKAAFKAMGKTFVKPSSTGYQVRYPDGTNSRWISAQYSGLLISAYFHKTKSHSATVVPKSLLFSTKYRSEAPAGKWAIAVSDATYMGDKTYYDHW